jgi:hypothetical protein
MAQVFHTTFAAGGLLAPTEAWWPSCADRQRRDGLLAPTEAWQRPGSCLAEVLGAEAAGRGGAARVDEHDDIRFEAALQRQKDCRARGEPLTRRAAFRAVWLEGQWGTAADAALAEQRFTVRLARYRAGHRATPEAWQRPGSCLAEALER